MPRTKKAGRKADALRKQKSIAISKEKKPSLFELKINRQKHAVLGRRSKFEKGMPGLSRARKIQKRKQTLLQEYKLSKKSNRFYDKRIGEFDKGLSAEDRMIIRYSKEVENQKTELGGNDDESKSYQLTHKGQLLTELEDYSDAEESEEERMPSHLTAKTVAKSHFGGLLTKKEQTEDAILSRISQKEAQQQVKSEQEVLVENLDSQWTELLGLLNMKKAAAVAESESSSNEDTYNTSVRELQYEIRVKSHKEQSINTSLSSSHNEFSSVDVQKSSDIKTDLLTVPSSYEDFSRELSWYSLPDTVHQIIQHNHPSLREGNKQKIETLFSHLLQYSVELSQKLTVSSASHDQTSLKTLLDRLNCMIPLLHDVASHCQEHSGRTLIKFILDTRQVKKKDNKLVMIFLLKTSCLLFPTSEFWHPLMTLVLISSAEVITNTQIVQRHEIVRGLFVCAMVIESGGSSGKVVPEVNYFLLRITKFLINHHLSNKVTASHTCSKLSLSDMCTSCDINEDFLVTAVSQSLTLINNVLRQLKVTSGMVLHQMFSPLLHPLQEKFGKSAASDYIKKFQDALQELKLQPLTRLVCKKAKVKPLRLLEPEFETESYVHQKKFKGPALKREEKRLKHKVKMESKSALREIRMDNYFLANQKIKEMKERDADRQKKLKELMSGLASQEGDFQALVRKKNKLKRK